MVLSGAPPRPHVRPKSRIFAFRVTTRHLQGEHGGAGHGTFELGPFSGAHAATQSGRLNDERPGRFFVGGVIPFGVGDAKTKCTSLFFFGGGEVPKVLFSTTEPHPETSPLAMFAGRTWLHGRGEGHAFVSTCGAHSVCLGFGEGALVTSQFFPSDGLAAL